MDPLSIATSVGSLSGACLLTLRNLGEAISKFKDAPKTLKDISSEAKIISISLSQLRNALVSDEYSISTQGLLEPDIRNALDVALTGCKMTLSCIESEISSLTKSMATDQGLSFSDRARVFWKDDKFKELLQQLSRQHNAIATLQQGFQMKALGDMVALMATNRATIQKVADGTQSLRGLYPQFNAAKSFLQSIESDDSHGRDFSVISERQFEFDDIVTSAQAYRRVLVAATHTLKTNSREQASGEESRTRTTMEGGPAGQESSSPHGANQSRKMNAASPSWAGGIVSKSTGSPPSDAPLGDGNSQSSTFKDSSSFAQQFRGYLDHVEGELRNSAQETANLRARLQEKDVEVERLQTNLETGSKKVETAETLLAISSSEYAHLNRKLKGVYVEVNDLKGELKSSEVEIDNLKRKLKGVRGKVNDLNGELQSRTHDLKESNVEMAKLLRELEAAKDELYIISGELHERKQTLKESAAENIQLSKRLQKFERELYEAECRGNRLIVELATKNGQVQKMKVESDQLEQTAKNFEDSIRGSHAAQLGGLLLVPMQSPAWLDESFKGPPQFQLINAPENPDGSVAKWDGQENKWIFADESKKMKEPEAASIVRTLPPSPQPKMTKTKESKEEKLEDSGTLSNLNPRSPLPWLTKKERPKQEDNRIGQFQALRESLFKTENIEGKS